MAIAKLSIRNYRSIADLDLSLGPLNALIGHNNSGKSNVLRALNIILGEAWPTRPFCEEDIHGFDPTQTIGISVQFDSALACDQRVWGFRLSWDLQRDVEYVALDRDGDPCYWGNGSVKRVNKEMRTEAGLLYLNLQRQADQQLRSTPWTLYGKLIKRIEESLTQPERQAFTDEVSRALDAHVREAINPAQTIIDDFVRRQTGLNIKLEFALMHPLDVLKNVRPYVVDETNSFDPEVVGAGVQSALAIAIAKAYTEIVRRPLTLAIEEPELYLHPHGCRHFYKLLRELSVSGLQVIYTTHERSFISTGEFQDLHLVRRTGGVTTVTSGCELPIPEERERLRLQSKFNDRINEVFFASCVVLVEGDADEIACRCALESIGVELDRKSISIVPLGGIREIPIVAEVLTGLGVPVVALIDEDPGNAATAQCRTQIENIVGAENLFVQQPRLEGIFGLANKPSRISAMAEFPNWFRVPGRACPELYTNLNTRIDELLS